MSGHGSLHWPICKFSCLDLAMATSEQDFERSIERQLRRAGIAYVKEPVVGRTQPDFLVTTPLGDRIIIEAKAWPRGRVSAARAAKQARVYAQLSRAVGALLITPSSTVFCAADGKVTSLPSLESALNIFSTIGSSKKIKPSARSSVVHRKRVFASMPFASRYDDTFLVAISPAALAMNATADRIDHNGESGDVITQVKAMIRRATVVVADLSESRPNVCHEIGYAEALGRPVIQICATSVKKLPFNLRNNQTIIYSIGQSANLKSRLQKELAKVL
jgi:hypothetical protein